jgi:hypothetical protein
MINRSALASIATAFTLVVSAASYAQTPPAPPAPGVTPPAPAAPATPGSEPAATPASPDECIKAAFDLAQAAEDKKLPDDKIEKVDELLTKMETHCDARQFTEAMAVGRDIRTLIDTQ